LPEEVSIGGGNGVFKAVEKFLIDFQCASIKRCKRDDPKVTIRKSVETLGVACLELGRGFEYRFVHPLRTRFSVVAD
jgi:predicted transcriptional regulator